MKERAAAPPASQLDEQDPLEDEEEEIPEELQRKIDAKIKEIDTNCMEKLIEKQQLHEYWEDRLQKETEKLKDIDAPEDSEFAP